MKKLLAICLAAALTLGLCGCEINISLGQTPQTTPENAQTTPETPNPTPTHGEQTTSAPAQTTPPELTEGENPYESWSRLVGYWHAADGQYFVLDMADSHSAWFEEGVWNTSYSRSGPVADLAQTDATIQQGKVCYSAVPGNAMDDPLPAQEKALTVDWTNLDNDGKIRIILDGQAYYCAWAGATREEAYAVHQQNLEDRAAYDNSLEGIWNRLAGCWDADGQQFVEFSFQNGKPSFRSGFWGMPVPYSVAYGDATGITVFEGFYTVSVSYPPLPGQSAKELCYTVMLSIYEDGTIAVEAPEDTLRTYTRCADSYEQGLQAQP